jgi:uncharacterized repeat protein (TIGR01451 family)
MSASAVVARAASNNPNDNNQDIADLSIEKSVSSPEVQSGQQVTYTLVVRNDGPRPGTQVQVHDTVPASVSVDSATVTEAPTPSSSCTIGADRRQVDCDIRGEINPTAPRPPRNGNVRAVVVIVGTVTGAPGTTVCNTASVEGNHRDTDPLNNNTSNEVCTVIQPPTVTHSDLRMVKSASPQSVSVGGELTYTLTVTNLSATTASSAATVTDLLPAGLAFVSATPSQGSCSGTTSVSCALGSIAAGGTASVVIKVKPTVDVAGQPVENCATVAAANDNAPGNDEGCVTVDVRRQADLSITKQADPVAIVGQDLVYTIKVVNNGPNAATDVVVTDDLPAQAAYQSATTTPGGSCTAPPANSGRVVCRLDSLASGATWTVRITVKPTAKKLDVVNTASVKATEDDPVQADNQSAPVKTAYVEFVNSGAFGESIDVRTLLRLRVTSGPLASVTLPAGGGGPFAASAVNVQVSGGLLLKDLVKLGVLNARTQGGKTADGQNVSVASSADVTDASLLNGLITVEAIHSECFATSEPNKSTSSATVAKLRIAGVLVTVAAGPNSPVTVPGVGQLILNEQIASGSGFNQTRSVNALHLKLDGLLAKGDIILAHSDCGIDP